MTFYSLNPALNVEFPDKMRHKFDLKTKYMTPTLLIIYLVIVMMLPNQICLASAKGVPQILTDELARLGIPVSTTGIWVYDLQNNSTLMEFRAEEKLNPASTIKLLTTFAGLEILGPAYRWKTEVYVDGTVENKKLIGNLIFKGYGDPKFTIESLWNLTRRLQNRDLVSIEGNIILDRSFFSVPKHDPGHFDNRPLRPYNQGPDALLLNFNSVELTFEPDKFSDSVAIYSDPNLTKIQVINKLVKGRGKCLHWPSKPIVNKNKITFYGYYPKSCGKKVRHYNLLEKNQYFSAVFSDFWTQLGGSFSGEVQEAPIPEAGTTLVSTHYSQPLTQIIYDINKHSNNVMARNLYLTLGSIGQNAVTTDQDLAKQSLRNWLASHEINPKEIIFDNGSGLSRTTKITPEALGKILTIAWRSKFMPEFVSSIPIAALDGTMKKRLKNTQLAEKAHLKTGYLKGVRAIAGYLHTKSSKPLVVVFMINHPRAKYAERAQEKLLKWIYNNH